MSIITFSLNDKIGSRLTAEVTVAETPMLDVAPAEVVGEYFKIPLETT